MKANVTILESNLEVEWDYKITAHGNNGCAPSLSYSGDPPEPAEFEIEIFWLEFPKKHGDTQFIIPNWLHDILLEHLYERPDINDIVQQADQERGGGEPDYDPDDA